MNTFRVTFSNNEPIAARPISGYDEGTCIYEHRNGVLIYAIVQAEDKETALQVCRALAREVQDNNLEESA